MSKLMKKKGLVKFLVFVLILVAIIVFFKIKGRWNHDKTQKGNIEEKEKSYIYEQVRIIKQKIEELKSR